MNPHTSSSPSEPRYYRLVVDIAAGDADDFSASLFELGATGVEERDSTTLDGPAQAGKVTLIASFASEEEARAAMDQVDPSLSPRIDELVGDAWRDSWKEHFRPFHLTSNIVVCPPWDHPPEPRAAHVLVLEPGRAFGTGLHATTTLVARSIQEKAALIANQPVLDVGCGTGILALCALMLGASRARAVDNDPDVIEVARENAARNGLGDRLVVDTMDVSRLSERYPLVLANIEATVLKRMAGSLQQRVAEDGLLILSGVLEHQVDEVTAVFSAMRLERVLSQDEWVALELRPKR